VLFVTGTAAARENTWRRMVHDPALFATVIILWALLALFILFPLVNLLAGVFIEGGHFTFANLGSILLDANNRQAFWNSLLLAALVGFCGTILGFLYAFTAVRANLSRAWSTVLDAASLLLLISPPFTSAIAMIFSFGARGLITYHLLGLKGFTVYGLHSTLFSETFTYFPLAYLTLKPILQGIDPNVEDMAFSLGSSRWRVFRTVTLPLTIPGLANAFLLLFAASLADFATPLILAGNSFPVLPTEAYLQITGLFDLKGGAVLSFVLLVPALVVYLLQRLWVSRRYYVTITGKAGARTAIKSVAPWARAPLLCACLLVAVVILYFYALLFYASVVVALGANHAWTWQHYRVIFTDGLKAIHDTLIIAGAGMPLGGFYAILLGYLVAKKISGAADNGNCVHAQLRPPRHYRGHCLSDRIQRSTTDADGNRSYHCGVLRVPLQSHGHPGYCGPAAADRSQHRRGLGEPGGQQWNHVPPHHPSPGFASVFCGPGGCLYPLHDGH
jgi:iron(III) transport system permease protein